MGSGKKVMEVVVQYEAKIKDKWYPVVRYDTSHGFFHRDLKDRWEWYKEKFKRGLK